jgi:quercetin dioxygenase-like cupin family protein
MQKLVSLSQEMETKPVIEGIAKKVPQSGKELLLEEYVYQEGAAAPFHTHDCEQIGYIVSGKMEMTLAGETHILGPGDCYLMPRGLEHDVKALTDAKTVLISSVGEGHHHHHDEDHGDHDH